MPRRKTKSSAVRPRTVLLFFLAAALLFAVVEGWSLWRSDSGRLMLAARFHLGSPQRVTQILSREIRSGLLAAGVSPDSIHPAVSAGDGTVHWHVGLSGPISLIQTNYAVTRRVTAAGGEILSGRERVGPRGQMLVTLSVGLPRRPFHEVTLVHWPRATEDAPPPARLAIVLYGFGDDPDHAPGYFALPAPFAVAIVPGGPASARLFHAAHQRSREVVLHLPLEPINYPRINPGPGTLLVTMNEARLTGLLRRDFDQAGDVAAVANHMGSLATQDMAVMTAVYRELARREVPFLHVQPAAGAVCKPLASSLGVVYEEPDVVLDSSDRPGATRRLDEEWKKTLKLATARGRLIVLMRARPELLSWLPRVTAAKRLGGVDLVPLSALIRRPATL